MIGQERPPRMEAGTRTGIVIIVLAAAVLAGALLVTGGRILAPAPEGTGTLTGNVTIGPLCPVEPCTVPPDRLAAAYAARPITISTASGTVVATVVADPVTGYAVPLAAGTYRVDIPHTGIGGSRDLPAAVTIRSGGITRLNISIDTGIR